MSILQIRLKNCLQTILDMQPAMRASCRVTLAEDLALLRSYLGRVDSMSLGEEDVNRLERMTSQFLRELGGCRSTVPAGRLQ